MLRKTMSVEDEKKMRRPGTHKLSLCGGLMTERRSSFTTEQITGRSVALLIVGSNQ